MKGDQFHSNSRHDTHHVSCISCHVVQRCSGSYRLNLSYSVLSLQNCAHVCGISDTPHLHPRLHLADRVYHTHTLYTHTHTHASYLQ